MSLYGWVILGCISGPFLLSFDSKVHFYTRWKALIPALLIVGVLFILWDEYFTVHHVWGFTPRYLSGIFIGHLPLEECLFFLVVPYSCVFIYEVIKAYFPQRRTDLIGKLYALTMVFSGLLLAIMHLDNWYTASACVVSALLIIGLFFVQRASWFGDYALSFLVVMIPFLVVNGILTGAVTDEPVVWYSSDHIIGLRIITIPLEDLYYNTAMLLSVTALYERFRRVLK